MNIFITWIQGIKKKELRIESTISGFKHTVFKY